MSKAYATVDTQVVRKAIKTWESIHDLDKIKMHYTQLQVVKTNSFQEWLYQEEVAALTHYLQSIGYSIYKELSAILSLHKLDYIEIPQEYCLWVGNQTEVL
jgi:hypothetical protein